MAAKSPLTMPLAWRVVWLALGVPLAVIMALGLVWNLTTPRYRYRDLTQDWLSARCYFEGRSIYTRHADSAPRYFGSDSDAWNVKINAHPPVSVLALLPVGLLEHGRALFLWNLTSLAMMVAAVWVVLGPWGLNCDSWYRLAAYCLLICSTPLAAQVKYAQFNPLLVLLIALAWVSDRHGKAILAGLFIGLAAGLKLFPGFLLLYFLCTRRWKALSVGAGTIALLHVMAVLVFGLGDVVYYFRDVAPQVNEWRSNWVNCSLAGFWSRLFDVTDGTTREWFHSPVIAKILTYTTSGALTAVVAWRTWCARTFEQRDMAFAAAVLTMLLVSPITWDHYLLLLLLPVAIAWYYAANTVVLQILLAGIVLPAGWVPMFLLWMRFFERSDSTASGFTTAQPWHSLTVLALPTYSLVAMVTLALAWLARRGGASDSPAAT